MTDFVNDEKLDKVADNTRLTDGKIASKIIHWSKKRGLRISDCIAVAYRMGYSDGRKSNQERINKAFRKLYANRTTVEPDVVSAADTGDADSQHEKQEPVTIDVITPNGNEEVEHNAEPEE